VLGFRKNGDLFDTLYGKSAPKPAPAEKQIPTVALDQLSPYRYSFDDGSKYPGSFGPTELLVTDYWTLRARSSQLFEQNLYARGLIRRLVTNVINDGLHLEAVPEEKVLGLEDDALSDWSEEVENRFHLWAKTPRLCDYYQQSTFGELQAMVYREALVCGDVLVVMRQDQRTRLPKIQIIDGSAVQTPLGRERAQRGNRIVHGVEIDSQRRHVAYWVTQEDGSSKRFPATGEKSGRRIAWLVYGTDRRHHDVRGKPILSLVLSSLKEIDRYRDSTQRKAVINSMFALFIEREMQGPSSGGLTRSSHARNVKKATDTEGNTRSFKTSEFFPGFIGDGLAPGEKPKAFTTNGTTEAFGVFEEAIIQSIAWANQIPPEILRLSFSNNYSASQAAINEFKMFLNPERTSFGQDLCQPVYVEWLLAETLARKIVARGLLEAQRDPAQYDLFAAWTLSDWSGHIKPAVDASKLVRGEKEKVDAGFTTRGRSTRELTGLKFSKVVKQLRKENEALVEANAPLMQLEAMKKAPPPADEPDETDREDDEDEDNEDASALSSSKVVALLS